MRADYLKRAWQDSAPDNTSSLLRARLFDARFFAPKFAPIAHQGRFAPYTHHIHTIGAHKKMPESERAVLYLKFQNGKMTRAA
jgi:hypothetical protein